MRHKEDKILGGAFIVLNPYMWSTNGYRIFLKLLHSYKVKLLKKTKKRLKGDKKTKNYAGYRDKP